MCLLTFLPAGVTPDLTALTNGAWINEDGHGFAIVTTDGLLVHRGLDAQEMIDAFAAARSRHPSGPALFHSRLATHGDTTVDNCHPFPVGDDNRTVIAHNGILPAEVQPSKKDLRSDTRIAAESFLPASGPLRLRRTRLWLQRWMGPHNKMVILTVDRRFREQAYILNEREGIWDDGIWYSNDGYLPLRYHRMVLRAYERGERAYFADEAELLERCLQCASLVNDLGLCRVCDSCLDCQEPLEECLCYQPSRLDQYTRRPARLLHRS